MLLDAIVLECGIVVIREMSTIIRKRGMFQAHVIILEHEIHPEQVHIELHAIVGNIGGIIINARYPRPVAVGESQEILCAGEIGDQ
jgi:hypothetical protein